ncbi:MAG: T9SS type A sorting domain-containing protein [Bacteroidia bacterium]
MATVNDTLYYNPLPYDEDGDDLLWSIDSPRTNINAVLYGYSTPAGSSGLNFSINPKTGEITWKPNAIGEYITSIRVEEFRNGIKIGEVVRDMLFVVKSILGNSSRAIVDTDTWNVDPSGNFVFYLNYNTPFHLQFVTNDANADSLLIEAKGIPFLLQNNPALFLTSVGAGVSISDFFWTPTFSDIKTDPYLVVFRIYEKGYITTLLRDRTIQLRVGNFTSINENDENYSIGTIYPVPSSGDLYIPVNVDKSSDLKISFVNQLGQEIKTFNEKLNSGQNLLYFNDLDLPAGIYFVKTIVDGNEQVKKLVIE